MLDYKKIYKEKKSYEDRLHESGFKSWYKFVRPRSPFSDEELNKIWFSPLSHLKNIHVRAMRPLVGEGEARAETEEAEGFEDHEDIEGVAND